MAIGKKQLQKLFELVQAHQLQPQAALDIALGRAPFPGEPEVPAETKTEETVETPVEEPAKPAPVAVNPIKSEKALFDHTGRRIPPAGMKAKQIAPDGLFRLDPPKLDNENDLAQRLAYFQLAFADAPALDLPTEFQRLKSAVAADERLANLLNGICLPIILPQINEDGFNYDAEFDRVFVPAAKTAYLTQFPNRTIRSGSTNLVTVVEASHGRLLERLFQTGLVALFFPGALHGFSLRAQREQMADPELPGSIYLAGGFDTLAAVAMYPDVMARDGNTLIMYMPALRHNSDGCTLYFESNAYQMAVANGVYVDQATNYNSGGLVFYLAE